MFIRDLFGRGRPTFSFEFFPPRTDEAAALLETTISELQPLRPSFVSVTYGAGGSTREKTIDIVSRIRRDTGIEAMAHLTCVGSSRQELTGILDRLADAGVENVLALRGDPPKGQTAFQAAEDGLSYGNELVSLIRHHHGQAFSIGAAAYPEKHTEADHPEVDLANLKRKTDAGADFLITQLFLDNQRYFDFVARARQMGITVPIVPGIMPITSPSQVDRFTSVWGASLPEGLAAELDQCKGDPTAILEVGIRHAIEQCAGLIEGGAPGIHFYTLNRSKATTEILKALIDRNISHLNGQP